MEEKDYVLTMLVENKPGVTARLSGLFAGRGYNIESFCGAPTTDPNVSRITIKTRTTPEHLEQVMKQIRRLVNVIKLRNMSGNEAVTREMALICVNAKRENRNEILRIVEIFRGKIVDTGAAHFIVEVTGRTEKVDAFIRLMDPMGIKKIARSGTLGLYREPD